MAARAAFGRRSPAAPSPEQVALSELRALQVQTPELWRLADAQCIGCGAALVLVGLTGAAAAIWGARKIMRERRPRNAAQNELRSTAERRTLFEKMLETDVTQLPPAP